MTPRVVIRCGIGDSLSNDRNACPDGFGLVSSYAARLASTAELRANERDKLKPSEPVKFGRLAKYPESSKGAVERTTSTRPKPALPLQLLHVIAGHIAQPEPV